MTRTTHAAEKPLSEPPQAFGHDFSRAISAVESTRALAPAACSSAILPENQPLSAASRNKTGNQRLPRDNRREPLLTLIRAEAPAVDKFRHPPRLYSRLRAGMNAKSGNGCSLTGTPAQSRSCIFTLWMYTLPKGNTSGAGVLQDLKGDEECK